MKLKILVYSIFILLVANNLNAQSSQSTIHLLDSKVKSDNRIIALIENENYVIYTTYNLLVKDCKSFIKKYNIDLDKDLLNIIINSESDSLYQNPLLNDAMRSRLSYRISDLLQKGNCLIFNKSAKRYEKLIYKETYFKSNIGPKRFKAINGSVIFESNEKVVAE